MGAAVDVATGGPLGASFTQLFGAGAGGAIILILVYLQYRKNSNGLESKAEAAAMAMLESIRQDAAAARADAAEVREQLVARDRLARQHEAWDRHVLRILNENGLITGDIGIPPSLVPEIEWRNNASVPTAGPPGA